MKYVVAMGCWLVLAVCIQWVGTVPPSAARPVTQPAALVNLAIRPQEVLTTATADPFTTTATATPWTTTPTASGTATATDTATSTATIIATATSTLTPTPAPVCNLPAWHRTTLPVAWVPVSIAAVSADDAWAVGDGILHWDGRHWQSVAPALPPGVGEAQVHFYSVAAGGHDSVWVVGSWTDGASSSALVEHWNGANWTILQVISPPDPTPTGYAPASGPSPTRSPTATATATATTNLNAIRFRSVSATGPTDAYIGGMSYQRLSLFHCDTTSCSLIAASEPGVSWFGYDDLVALSPTDIWGVGHIYVHPYDYVNRWDGTSLSGAGSFTQFGYTDIAVAAADNAWAELGGIGIAHWDGSAWNGSVPNPTNISGRLKLTAPRGGMLWAFNDAVARWDGTSWTPLPGQQATQIVDLSPLGPASAWAVGQDANGKPVAEYYGVLPTFADVPAGDGFAPYIEWMACRAIIGGYPCGGPEPCDDFGRPVFRPGNGVSRGQLLKMAVLTAGWPLLNPATATFADVPPASTFYQAIETGVAQGIITGYPCGGSGEPCDADQRPYFRPAAAVSRGQLSKILALARGYSLPDPPTATFADVPPGSTFYGYVEAVAAQGIVSGYPCGGSGEPCDSGSRPYFRPTNGATRAQVSKMVTRAFGGP